MVFRLPQNEDNIGNPLPAIHGGVIAGFLEHASMLHLLMFMGAPPLPKIIDFSIHSLRPAHYRDTFAASPVWRPGRRVANFPLTPWHTLPADPIATARCPFKQPHPYSLLSGGFLR